MSKLMGKFLIMLFTILLIISFGLAYIFNTTLKNNYLNLEEELILTKVNQITTILEASEYFNKSEKNLKNVLLFIQSFVKKHSLDKGVYLFLFDKDGKMLIHPDKTLIGDNFTSIKNNMTGGYLYKELINGAKNNQQLKYNISIDKTAWVKYNQHFDWYIGASISTEELDQKTSTLLLKSFYLIMITLISVFLITIFYFDEIILNPIKLILSNVKKVRNGDLQVRNNINRSDEIGNLSDAFDDMVSRLEAWVEQLDEKIRQKTKELQNMNELLEDKVHKEVLKNREKDKQMLQQFRLAQMGEMLSMIAHQWRQPLSAISTTTIGIRLTLNKIPEVVNYEIKERLTSIEEQVQYLSHTIDDFSDFFKPYKLKEHSTFMSIFEKSYQLIEFNFKNKNIEIIRNFKSHDTINTYPNELIQTLINILKNAIDNFEIKNVKNRIITVSTESDKNYCVLTIRDNGGGVDENIIDSIFDPYFSTKSQKNGTGLGLYMSKMIVEEQCGGYLKATNFEDGLCFQIGIPKDEID